MCNISNKADWYNFVSATKCETTSSRHQLINGRERMIDLYSGAAQNIQNIAFPPTYNHSWVMDWYNVISVNQGRPAYIKSEPLFMSMSCRICRACWHVGPVCHWTGTMSHKKENSINWNLWWKREQLIISNLRPSRARWPERLTRITRSHGRTKASPTTPGRYKRQLRDGHVSLQNAATPAPSESAEAFRRAGYAHGVGAKENKLLQPATNQARQPYYLTTSARSGYSPEWSAGSTARAGTGRTPPVLPALPRRALPSFNAAWSCSCSACLSPCWIAWASGMRKERTIARGSLWGRQWKLYLYWSAVGLCADLFLREKYC